MRATAYARPAPPAPAWRPRRILVVDDYPQSADSLAKILNLRGFEARTAQHGQEALTVADAFRPDVALLDLRLPGLDGFEVCRRIRRAPWGKDMVVLAVTGLDRDEDRARSASVGFDGYVVKPVDFAAVERLMDGLAG